MECTSAGGNKILTRLDSADDCSLVVSQVGVPTEEEPDASVVAEPLGVGSSNRARQRLSKSGIQQLRPYNEIRGSSWST